MSDFALKIPSLNSLTKSFFRYSEGLIQIIWVRMKVSENPYIFYGRRIFCSRWSEKKNLARCQILRSKYYLYTVHEKVFFNTVKDSFKSYRSYVRVKSQNMFLGRKNFCSEWSEKQVLSTMSGFALKILSLNSLTKSCFRYSEGLIQIIWVPMKVSENPYMFYGRRIFCSRYPEKKNLARCQILHSKYYL